MYNDIFVKRWWYFPSACGVTVAGAAINEDDAEKRNKQQPKLEGACLRLQYRCLFLTRLLSLLIEVVFVFVVVVFCCCWWYCYWSRRFVRLFMFDDLAVLTHPWAHKHPQHLEIVAFVVHVYSATLPSLRSIYLRWHTPHRETQTSSSSSYVLVVVAICCCCRCSLCFVAFFSSHYHHMK